MSDAPFIFLLVLYFYTETNTRLYCLRCDGVAIPKHIMRVLFFFYRLQRHTNLHGLSNYVVPTPNLRLKVNHKEKHKVDYVYEVVERNLVENELEDDACAGSSGKFLLGPAMRKRSRQNDGESLKQKEAFTIRVCFTGASFEEEGAAKQTLFCTAEITPLRNFNILPCVF